MVTDQFCCIRFHFNLTGEDKKKRRWREGWGGGNYLREAIILNISIKGGQFEGGD